MTRMCFSACSRFGMTEVAIPRFRRVRCHRCAVTAESLSGRCLTAIQIKLSMQDYTNATLVVSKCAIAQVLKGVCKKLHLRYIP